MPTFTLTDVSHEVWVEDMTVDAAQLGLAVTAPWSVSKRRLRGGRRDGVDLIVVDNGRCGSRSCRRGAWVLWKGFYLGNYLGWESPITDGPVHPAFVNLMAQRRPGLARRLRRALSRCGLENNGAPFEVKTVNPDGAESHTTFGLHGRIANIPASYVAVHVTPEPPHEIAIDGHVEKRGCSARASAWRLEYATVPGSNRADDPRRVHQPQGSAGARCRSSIIGTSGRPSSRRAPGSSLRSERDPAMPGPRRASTATIATTARGRASPSRCITTTIARRGPTLAMLRDREGDKAVVLRFRKDQLPAFTLWKNTAGLRDGYVTGLEPATNYPNKLPFEKARGRVVTLPPGGRYVVDLSLEVLVDAGEVAAIEEEIRRRQAEGGRATVNPRPVEPFAPVMGPS